MACDAGHDGIEHFELERMPHEHRAKHFLQGS